MQAARPVLRVGAAIVAAGARNAAAGARRSVTVQAHRGVSLLAGAPARFKSSPRLNALQGITSGLRSRRFAPCERMEAKCGVSLYESSMLESTAQVVEGVPAATAARALSLSGDIGTNFFKVSSQ